MHDGRTRKLQLCDHVRLRLDGHVVALHERITEVGHVAVAHARTGERVESDPHARFLVGFAQRVLDAALARQQVYELARGPRVVALALGRPAVNVFAGKSGVLE